MQFMMCDPAIRHFSNWTSTETVACIAMLFIALAAAAFLGAWCGKEFHGNRRKTIWVFVGITAAVTLALICFFGYAATAIRGIILCLALLFASYSDIRTRECGNVPFLLIAVAAFIGIELDAVPFMFLAAFTAFVLQFYGAWITKSTLNGADLKMAVACCFMLGTVRGIAGLVIGMLVGIVVSLLKKRGMKEGFPLLPYLAVGFMTAYFI